MGFRSNTRTSSSRNRAPDSGGPRSRGRRRSGAFLAILALTALLATLAAPTASANFSPPPKKLLVTFGPATATAGSTTTFTVNLKNEASSGDVNTVDLQAPAGFLVTSAVLGVHNDPPGEAEEPYTPSVSVVPPGTIQLRNLDIDPGQTQAVTITAVASCTASAFAWTVPTLQSGFTLDTASALAVSVTGSCHLAFGGQPANAAKNTNITTSPFNNPAGGPITVAVFGTDNTPITLSTAPITLTLTVPNGAGLTGGGPVSAVGGVASFAALQVNLHGSYSLTAASPGLTSATSGPFTIVDAAASCATSCSATASATATTTNVTAPSNTGTLILSVGVDTLDCGDSALWNHAPSVTTIDQQGVNAIKTATVTIDKSFVNSSLKNRIVLLYRVCYSSPVAFKDFLGRTTNLGLLPRCRAWDDFLYPPEYRHTTVPPCVDSIVKDSAGNVVETLKLPASDPRMR